MFNKGVVERVPKIFMSRLLKKLALALDFFVSLKPRLCVSWDLLFV